MFIASVIATIMVVPWLFFMIKKITRKNISITGHHVMITGGSSGIGKSVAMEVVKRGANVSILARNQEKLDAAKKEIEAVMVDKNKQQVFCYSVDVSSSFKEVVSVVEQTEHALGPINMLVNCAGTSISGRFDEQDISEFKRMMDVNYFGTVNITRAVVPLMKQKRAGRIVITSSMAGLAGLYGFTSYSASKFALRGLAESLHMEVKPYNISVTVSYPPDTDTPGFEEEQKHKPEETRLISEAGGLVSAHEVAHQLLEDALNGKYHSVVGMQGWLLSTVCTGMSPITSVITLITEVTLMGLCRLISACFLAQFDGIVQKCMSQRDQNKKSN